MNRFPLPATLAWLALVAVMAAFIGGGNRRQAAQIERLSNNGSVAQPDDRSPTGYVRSNRNLILPSGQPWIMDTQRMAAANSWSVKQADYDNAPEGRSVQGAAPYRWWLRLVAGLMGGNRGQAIERAALYANPILHLLLCTALGLLAAWRFGASTGGLVAFGIAALFPFTAAFGAGQPDDYGLFLAANLAGLMLALAGAQAGSRKAAVGWFLAASAAAGLGLWLDADGELVLLGAGWIGWAAAVRFAPQPEVHAPFFRAWRLWLAGGIVLAGLAGLVFRNGFPATFGPRGAGLFAYTAADSLAGWLREGFGFPLGAALLPLLLLGAAIRAWRQDPARRSYLAFGLGLSTVLFGLAAWQLRWWGLLDVALLGLLVPVLAGLPAGFTGMGVRTGMVILLLPGLIVSWPRRRAGEEISPAEARALIERDLAQWLAVRSEPGAIAFAPPALSGSLCYHGGLRVVASPYPGNDAGMALAVRISGITSMDEAQAIVQRRGIQYIILPSWDMVLDEFAKVGSPTPERSLIALLRQWLPPRWLRPVPYQAPVVAGLENATVAVFEVVEPQENAIALSRLAGYFVETGQLHLAAAVSDSLERGFAQDAGALVARAQVALARGEGRTLARVLPELLAATADGKDEDLPWERRANLAVVLAQARQSDLARKQVDFCLAEADVDRLRSLGTLTLYRLLALAGTYHLDFAEPGLRANALALLPVEFREQLQP